MSDDGLHGVSDDRPVDLGVAFRALRRQRDLSQRQLMETEPDWRNRGLERRLLGCLGRELAGRGAIELVTLAYHGPDAEHLHRLGFHPRVRTVGLLTAPAIGW